MDGELRELGVESMAVGLLIRKHFTLHEYKLIVHQMFKYGGLMAVRLAVALACRLTHSLTNLRTHARTRHSYTWYLRVCPNTRERTAPMSCSKSSVAASH